MRIKLNNLLRSLSFALVQSIWIWAWVLKRQLYFYPWLKFLTKRSQLTLQLSPLWHFQHKQAQLTPWRCPDVPVLRSNRQIINCKPGGDGWEGGATYPCWIRNVLFVLGWVVLRCVVIAFSLHWHLALEHHYLMHYWVLPYPFFHHPHPPRPGLSLFYFLFFRL